MWKEMKKLLKQLGNTRLDISSYFQIQGQPGSTINEEKTPHLFKCNLNI